MPSPPPPPPRLPRFAAYATQVQCVPGCIEIVLQLQVRA
jgi:hypothetical protein